jgi:hypothetical protein
VESPAAVCECRAVEARRPEHRRGIVREAVALLGLAEQAGLHLRLVVLGVENRDRIGPRRNAAEHAGGVPVLDRRDRPAHFAPRFAEAVSGGVEPAAHRSAVVAHPLDRDAQSCMRLRARRSRGAEGKRREQGQKHGPHPRSPDLHGFIWLCRRQGRSRATAGSFQSASC